MGDEFGLELPSAACQVQRLQGIDVTDQFGYPAAAVDLDAKFVTGVDVAQVTFVAVDLRDRVEIFAEQFEPFKDA